ncbi:hypothetical protein Aperf_G00000059161 [Anoplocephala perfoliata]
MCGEEDHFQIDETLTGSLRQIILASGDYFIVNSTVSDMVVDVLQKHSDYIAEKFHSRLGAVSSLTLSHLISSLSDSNIHLNRIYTFISTRVLVNGGVEDSESTKILNSAPSKMLAVFRSACDALNINIEDSSKLPTCLHAGQQIRSQRIDAFVTHKSTTEQYVAFTRLRSKATLYGKPFDIWLERGGFKFSQKNDAAHILAYLVTLCLRDVIDCALCSRQRFGIDMFSQITAIELQQASTVIRKMKDYL